MPKACRFAISVKKYRKPLFYLLFPGVSYLIPQGWIFSGEHPLCLFRNLFGWECYGCGMTRAIFSLLYGDPAAAWAYNRLVVVVAPLLGYLWLKAVVQSFRTARGVQP